GGMRPCGIFNSNAPADARPLTATITRQRHVELLMRSVARQSSLEIACQHIPERTEPEQRRSKPLVQSQCTLVRGREEPKTRSSVTLWRNRRFELMSRGFDNRSFLPEQFLPRRR